MYETTIYVEWWWEKYLLKYSFIKQTCSWIDKLIILWTLKRYKKVFYVIDIDGLKLSMSKKCYLCEECFAAIYRWIPFFPLLTSGDDQICLYSFYQERINLISIDLSFWFHFKSLKSCIKFFKYFQLFKIFQIFKTF